MREIFLETLLEIISYPVGCCVCRLVTLGQYPKSAIFDSHSRSYWADLGIMLV